MYELMQAMFVDRPTSLPSKSVNAHVGDTNILSPFCLHAVIIIEYQKNFLVKRDDSWMKTYIYPDRALDAPA
jgi:hypothetical protein